MKKLFEEFKTFALRGNVLDLAVGVIIGGAFGAITTSLIDDLLMPLIGILVGGIDFGGLSVTVGGAVLTYGNFISAVLNFLLIALVVFLLVKSVNALTKKKEAEAPAAPPEPSAEEKLLTEIRDLLREKK